MHFPFPSHSGHGSDGIHSGVTLTKGFGFATRASRCFFPDHDDDDLRASPFGPSAEVILAMVVRETPALSPRRKGGAGMTRTRARASAFGWPLEKNTCLLFSAIFRLLARYLSSCRFSPLGHALRVTRERAASTHFTWPCLVSVSVAVRVLLEVAVVCRAPSVRLCVASLFPSKRIFYRAL